MTSQPVRGQADTWRSYQAIPCEIIPLSLSLSLKSELESLSSLLKFSGFLVFNMWDSENESVGGRDYNNGVATSNKHGVKTDGFEQRGQSWYVKIQKLVKTLH